MRRKSIKGMLSAALVLTMVMPMQPEREVYAANNEIQYEFSGEDAATPGYAQGKVTFTAQSAGTYYLYWADDTKALDGYYEIADLEVKAGESKSFTFGYHTAIPADATKIIVTTGKSNLNVKDAAAVYDIPSSKQLTGGAGNLLYTFNSYSDVHIDTEVYYTNCQKNWKNALKYAVDKDTDFIISAGDAVTNAKGFSEEWDVYEKILAESDYTNPVWETNGNHDMRDEATIDGTAVKEGIKTYDYKGNLAFNKATGTDSTVANLNANKPYYYVVEQNTGDVFIFMALENGYKPANHDNFSKEQIEWLKDLLDTFYGTGVNVYIIEHATFQGYGPGDVWKANGDGSFSSYYGGHMYANGMKTSNGTTISGREQNTAFKEILDTYKDVIWMSGHTHQDFALGNNYCNENGTACNMIHNPGVVGTTYLNEKGEIEYDSSSSASDGKGLNSQGYYVETYENAVVYYGANLTEEKIYPEYCYIMEGARASKPIILSETRKAISPSYETLVPQKEIISSDATLEEALTLTKSMMEKYYAYASYDQYQNLKKYYYQYKNTSTVDRTKAVEDLKYASGQLYAVIHKNVAGNENTHFALCYYNKGVHAWTDVDEYFTRRADGLYVYTYTAQNTNEINVNVYDTTSASYNCIGESTSVTFADGLSQEYTLTAPVSTRGKSITIKDMEVGNKVTFLYDSNLNHLTITCSTTSPTPTVGGAVTGECVYYGSYPQTEITEIVDCDVYKQLQSVTGWDDNGDTTIGTEKYRRIKKKDATSTANSYTWENDNVYHYFKYEPIEWRVLQQKEGEIILVSDVILDTQKFNQKARAATWENSTLRSWLNGLGATENTAGIDYSETGFLHTAFTREEQEKLLSKEDKVELLTESQATGNCRGSDYAKAMGAVQDAQGFHNWWLATSGNTELTARYVQADGTMYAKGYSIAYAGNGVRVAIHLASVPVSPSPFVSLTVTPTVTEEPTVTAEPTVTEEPTITAEPTVTEEPTITAEPTVTTEPTVTEVPTATEAPTATVVPTATEAPTVTEVATATPTATAVPSAIATPTTMPKSTPISVPTKALRPTAAPTKVPTVKKGTIYKDKKTKAVYKVTKAGTKNNGTVQYVKPTSSKVTAVTIPATIKIKGSTYKVTSIADKALQKKTKLKKVVIGKNVSAIGKNAFYGCKKLKTIQIKTSKLTAKKVGKNAFKGIYKKAKIKVPAKKQKAYKKILKTAGVGKEVKITK